jgi:hypothetical protein
MIVARQFIAWNMFQPRIRPGGHGLILTPGGLTVLIVAYRTQSHRSLRDGSCFRASHRPSQNRLTPKLRSISPKIVACEAGVLP